MRPCYSCGAIISNAQTYCPDCGAEPGLKRRGKASGSHREQNATTDDRIAVTHDRQEKHDQWMKYGIGAGMMLAGPFAGLMFGIGFGNPGVGFAIGLVLFLITISVVGQYH